MNARIAQWTRALARDARGLTTVEYVIVLCLIAAVAVATWKTFGDNVLGYLDGAVDKIDNAMTPQGG